MNVHALTVLYQLPLQSLSIVAIDDPGWNGEEFRQLCGAAASCSSNDLEAFCVGSGGDRLNKSAVGPNALGKLLQLGLIEGAARVSGGLVNGVDGDVLEFAAVLHGGSPWAWVRLRLWSGHNSPVRSCGGGGLGVLFLLLLLQGFNEAL